MNYLSFLPSPGALVALQLLWLFLEPLCIHFAGTTAGKWIFGIYLTDLDGRHLSYHAAFWRTLKVYFFGMGLQIPILELYCLYKSYQNVADGWKPAWDDGTEYLQKRPRYASGAWRYMLLAASCLASFVITYGCILYAQVPINHGDLTLTEFVENYNQAVQYFDYPEYYQLKPDGTFYTFKEAYQLHADKSTAGNQAGIRTEVRSDTVRTSDGVVIDLLEFDPEALDFVYSFDGEALKQVKLHICLQNYGKDSYIAYPRIQMALAAYAFAGAQDGVRFWKNERGKMLEKLTETDLMESFSYQIGGMDIACDVKCTGFERIMDHLIAEDERNQFFLEFTVGR